MAGDDPIPPSDAPAGAFFDFRKTNTVRSFVLLGIAAVAGLAIAGFGLFTAKGTSTFVVPADAVALVNQRPVYRADFDSQLRVLFDVDRAHSTAEQRRKVLEDMIREELYVQRGIELDLASSDLDVRSALVNAVEAQIAADAVTRKPKDAELQAYYKAHTDKYVTEGRMTVRDLVPAAGAADPARMQAAGEAARAGAGAEALKARFGLRDSGKVNGEEFYFAAKIHLGEALFAAAKDLADGAAAGPLQGSDGPHILVMEHNLRPQPIPFAEAQAQVKNDYVREATQRLQKGAESFLRKRANVLIAKDVRE